jgi:hypothetical protein
LPGAERNSFETILQLSTAAFLRNSQNDIRELRALPA